MTLPRWTICVEHSILITDEMHGSCPKCNGDRNLIQVHPVPGCIYTDLEDEHNVALEALRRIVETFVTMGLDGAPDWKRFAMHLRNIARVYLEALKRQ